MEIWALDKYKDVPMGMRHWRSRYTGTPLVADNGSVGRCPFAQGGTNARGRTSVDPSPV